MTMSFTISTYHVPYNGPVSIFRVYGENRKLEIEQVWWLDPRRVKLVTHVIDVPRGLSKQQLLKAVLYMGTSIKGRTLKRLKKEAERETVGDIILVDIRREEVPLVAPEA